jgi:hypothetical protein
VPKGRGDKAADSYPSRPPLSPPALALSFAPPLLPFPLLPLPPSSRSLSSKGGFPRGPPFTPPLTLFLQTAGVGGGGATSPRFFPPTPLRLPRGAS